MRSSHWLSVTSVACSIKPRVFFTRCLGPSSSPRPLSVNGEPIMKVPGSMLTKRAGTGLLVFFSERCTAVAGFAVPAGGAGVDVVLAFSLTPNKLAATLSYSASEARLTALGKPERFFDVPSSKASNLGGEVACALISSR